MLLYGPPGTGKTLIARQIGKILNCVEPKIINGPELLNGYVGDSEENVRDLFKDAIEDKEGKRLHLIICDEFDAICKSRDKLKDNTSTLSNIVNQFLSMLDPVNPINNIFMIAMTNRKEDIDPAILRPGRLEIQLEIKLPDEIGRYEILKIHSKKLHENNLIAPDVDFYNLAKKTVNFSGAELEGLVKSALSFSLNKQLDKTTESNKRKDINIIVSENDFEKALGEIKPMFGTVPDEIQAYTKNKIVMNIV